MLAEIDEQTRTLGYKTQNSPEYNKALKRWGALTNWFDPDMTSAAKPIGKWERACS